MQKYILTLLVCLVGCVAATAQSVSPLTNHNAAPVIDQWFREANRAVQTDQANPLRQQIAAGISGRAATPPSNTMVTAAASRPWQLAFFLAVDESRHKAADLLPPVEAKIKQGQVQWAVVFDIVHCLKDNDSNSSGQGKKGGEIVSQCKVPLYFLYKSGNQVVRKTAWFESDSDYKTVLNQFFQNFKKSGSSLYTGVIFNAHGSGIGMNGGSFDASHIAASAYNNNLHIDILELDSCHMSSLYSAYYLSNWENVDYLNAASDYAYSTPSDSLPFPLLGFLNFEPKDAARLSVKRRADLFNWDGYDTTSYASVQLSTLKEPLENWMNSYVRLRQGGDPNTGLVLRRLAAEGYEWESLRTLLQRYKTYVKAHFNDIHAPTQLKNEFITASENLISALSKATQTQWCYSAKTHRLYKENIPSQDESRCLESISVDSYQVEYMYEVKTQ